MGVTLTRSRAPSQWLIYSFKAYRYLLTIGHALVDLVLERYIIESLAIIEENQITLSCLDLLDATAVQTIVSPGSFIHTPIMYSEDTGAISLSFIMLAHVPIELMIQREAEAVHEIVLEHALVHKSVVVDESANAMFLMLIVYLTVVDVVGLRNANELFVQV